MNRNLTAMLAVAAALVITGCSSTTEATPAAAPVAPGTIVDPDAGAAATEKAPLVEPVFMNGLLQQTTGDAGSQLFLANDVPYSQTTFSAAGRTYGLIDGQGDPVQWKSPSSFSIDSVLGSGGALVALGRTKAEDLSGSAAGTVLARIDPRTGKILWKREGSESGSMSVSARIIATTEPGLLNILDAETGADLFSLDCAVLVSLEPFVTKQSKLADPSCVSDDPEAPDVENPVFRDPATGAELGPAPASGGLELVGGVSNLIVADPRAQALSAVSPGGGVVWKIDLAGTILAADADHVLVRKEDTVFLLDAATGESVESFDTTAGPYSGMREGKLAGPSRVILYVDDSEDAPGRIVLIPIED